VGEPERKTLVKQLELVYRESQRCTAIVRNLLDFARERPLQLKEVDVDAAVDEAFMLLSNQAAIQGVEFVKETVTLQPVEADFGQLRQAFVNIAMNAIEAMPGGGRLAVTTRTVPDEAAVEVVFADTGRGITPEVMKRIFDPFFTTKEKGTGLGLAISARIVAAHGGDISARRGSDRGTCVRIRLPLSPPGGGTAAGDAVRTRA
jgi:two-component system NtrC family sensor kinase